jgi:hypothetical protein
MSTEQLMRDRDELLRSDGIELDRPLLSENEK